MKTQKTILITGASSGIGFELANQYASENINLLLIGRNKDRLKKIKNICEDKQANVEIAIADVTDKSLMKNIIEEYDKKNNIDLVIANSGISSGTDNNDVEDSDIANNVLNTNIMGVLNTINPAIDKMMQRKSGHIAIVSSLAGFKAMPASPAYSTSKIAIRNYGEAIKPILNKNGIKLSVICPGFIKTPLTDANNFKMPMIMSVKKAAKIIINGLEKEKSRIAFPLPIYIFVLLLSYLPNFLTDKLLLKASKGDMKKPLM